MSARKFIVMLVLLALVPACAPTNGTDVVEDRTAVSEDGTDVFEVGIEPASATDANNQALKDSLQPILRAMLGGSIDDQLAAIQYSQVACANMDGLGAPPRCPEGVAEGTVMQVFPMLGSESSFAKPEEMAGVLDRAIVKGLYAVYRVTPNPNIEPWFPEGEYAMIFERDMNDISLPVVLRVLNGKIVRMDFSAGVSAADLLKEIPVEHVLVTPQEAQAWTESIR